MFSSDVCYFQILLQLGKHEIQIYGFPHSELDGDTEHHWMRERMPFAVVGSNTTLTDPETGLRYRGREYPWGCVNIEDKVRGDWNVVNYANQVIDGTICRCCGQCVQSKSC